MSALSCPESDLEGVDHSSTRSDNLFRLVSWTPDLFFHVLPTLLHPPYLIAIPDSQRLESWSFLYSPT